MDEDKSREYRKLVAKVKLRYRENPICNIEERFNCSTLTELIGDGKPYRYGDTNIYPMAHPGYWGTMNRGIENVKKDWMRIKDE